MLHDTQTLCRNLTTCDYLPAQLCAQPTVFAYIIHLYYLLHGILYGCASEQEAIAATEGQQYLPTQARAALNGLGLVQYHVLPLDSVKILHILNHLVIRRGRERGERREEREGWER